MEERDIIKLTETIERIVATGGVKAYQAQVISQAIIALLVEKGFIAHKD